MWLVGTVNLRVSGCNCLIRQSEQNILLDPFIELEDIADKDNDDNVLTNYK